MDDIIIIKTYKAFWDVELSITNIEGHQLPFAFTGKKIFYFIVSLIILNLLVKIPGIHLIRKISVLKNPLIFYTLLPLGMTYYLNRLKIDGKQPYIYVIDMVVFLLSPKRYEFFKPIKKMKSIVIKETIRYRIEDVVNIFEFKESEESKKKYRFFYKYV